MKKIKIEANIRMSLEIPVDKIDTLGKFEFDNVGDNNTLNISKESARTFLEHGKLEEGSYIPTDVFNQADLIETEFDPAQVRFDWDDTLEGKVAAFADNINELKRNFNRDNPEFIGVISKNRQSTNTSFPFVCNNEYKYRFVYLLEKDLEVKQ